MSSSLMKSLKAQQAQYDDGEPEYLSFINGEGLRLQGYLWYPDCAKKSVKAVIVLLHGYTSHSRFTWLDKPKNRNDNAGKRTVRFQGSWVQQLLSEKFIVAAYDMQSHGLSEGLGGRRCAILDLDSLARDAILFLRLLDNKLSSLVNCADYDKSPNENADSCRYESAVEDNVGGKFVDGKMIKSNNVHLIRVFVCGLSLGGWTVARMLQIFSTEIPEGLRTLQLCGCALLSPMLSLAHIKHQVKYKYTKHFLALIAYAMPHMIISSRKETFFHSYLIEYAMQDFLLYCHGPRASVVRELFRGVERIHLTDNMEFIKSDVCNAIIIFHNYFDETCTISGSYAYYTNLRNIIDKTFVAINVPADDETISQHNNVSYNDCASISPDSTVESLYHKLLPLAEEGMRNLDVFHDIVSEPSNSTVFRRLLRWISCRL